MNYDIFIDGRSVKDQITGASISFSEDQVHNEITIQAADLALWPICDPFAFMGTARIMAIVGARSMAFLLERRDGSEASFQVWGRSLTALDDDPYSDKIEYKLTEAKPASSIAAEIVGQSVDWQVIDWLVPKTFEFNDYPLRGLILLSEQIGAVVRSDDAGGFIVRPRYPVRPVHMQAATPTVEYDRLANLIELSVQESRGSGKNRITVNGWGPATEPPQMEVEDPPDGTRDIGDDTFVRVYWAGRQPAALPDHYATAGQVFHLGDASDQLTETVDFQEGAGRVAKPIISLDSVTWIGDESPGLDWTPNSSELRLQGAVTDDLTTIYRVAKITYTTSYSRYRLANHAVERALLALSIPVEREIQVVVAWGSGDKEADAVEAPLLTTQAAAAARGTAELDQASYNTRTMSMAAPYHDAAVDGAVVSIEDGELSVTGNCHVRSAQIVFDGPSVINRLECVRCLV
jgi:hypothetical protein